jgi:hypothetical protein
MADDMRGSTIDGELPDGRIVPDLDGGMGDVQRGQLFTDRSEGAIRASVTAAAAGLGLRLVSLRVLRPLDAAPAIVVESSEPEADAARFAQLIGALLGTPTAFEGYYLELRDGDGNAVARVAASFRTGAGHFWVAPAYRTVVNIPHG